MPKKTHKPLSGKPATLEREKDNSLVDGELIKALDDLSKSGVEKE